MTAEASGGASDLVLTGGKVVTLDDAGSVHEAIALRGDRIVRIGSDAEIAPLAGPETDVIDLAGRTVIPGLIDGHAHMDREGLKTSLPSLAGARSIDDILDIVRALAADRPPGEWIVTMPIGEPPMFENVPECLAEGRFPTRHDLDRAAPDHPVYIRSIWGYWRPALPIVSIANSRALQEAGIDRTTRPPAPSIEIEHDASGEPTGVLIEHNKMPVVELTLMACAPSFDVAIRTEALSKSMRLYNAVGTTGVFEGHGVAAEVVEAYRRLREAGRQTVRGTLVFSPAWKATGDADTSEMVRSWARWLAGSGLGDDWLKLQGIYTEVDDSVETGLRAAAAPQTGWAGFHYDSAVPRDRVRDVLVEAARNGLQAVGIFPYMLDMYDEVDRIAPIGGLRWIQGHLETLTGEQIARVRDLGLGVTTHTSQHVFKRGKEHQDRLGPEREREIVPLRSLLDEGVPVSLGTDNVPISLFHSIWHCVARRSRLGDRPVAPDQALTREEALRCATSGGAWLSYEEDRRGSLEPGKLADMAVLTDDPLTCPEAALKDIVAEKTIAGGKVVFDRSAGGPLS